MTTEEKRKEFGEYLKKESLDPSTLMEMFQVSQPMISALLNGKKAFGKKTAAKWAEKLNVNASWLLTGEGEMLKDGGGHEVAVESTDSLTRGKVIPLYDVEAVAGNGYEMNMTPTSRPTKMIQIGGFLSDSESAIQVFGNSMVPNYPAGCIIGVRLHRDSFIEPGKVYVIETRDNRFLKRLYLNKEKTAYRCLSDNHMKHSSGPMEGEYCYPEFDIPFDDVIRLHRVIGVIKRNTM